MGYFLKLNSLLKMVWRLNRPADRESRLALIFKHTESCEYNVDGLGNNGMNKTGPCNHGHVTPDGQRPRGGAGSSAREEARGAAGSCHARGFRWVPFPEKPTPSRSFRDEGGGSCVCTERALRGRGDIRV